MDRQREIDEAKAALSVVTGHLENAKRYLKSARNWGIWDILGGGSIVSAIKRSKLERARTEAMASQDAMLRLSKELSDISVILDDLPEISLILDIADIFFDNIISDLMMQSKIKRFNEQIDAALAKLYAIEQQLQIMR